MDPKRSNHIIKSKSKILKLLLFSTLLLITSCIEKNKIQKVETLDIIKNQIDNLDENALVIFDVDNTLITPIDKFFHIKSSLKNILLWVYYAIKTRDFFLSKGYWYFNTAFFQAKCHLVDTKTPSLIKALQKRNVKVIALTKCPTGQHKSKHGALEKVEDWRINQLLHFGIDFSFAFPQNDNILFPHLHKTDPPLFKKGILFCNKYTKKGILLKEFLKIIKKQTGWEPSLVIFIDDKLKNSKLIRNEMEKMGIECIALHYTAADIFLSDVDMKVVTTQMKYIIEEEKWINEKEAKKLLEIKNKSKCYIST